MFGKKILFIWGGLDILYFIWIILQAILSSKIPFYTDLVSSYDFALSYENNLPIYGAWLSVMLHISILVSGILLLFGRRVGIILSYIQFPLRILLLIPSLFFLTWLFEDISFPYFLWVVYSLIICTEIFKLFTLRRCFTLPVP